MDAIDQKLIEDAACAAGLTIDRWGEDNKGVPVAYYINEQGGHSAFQPLYENGCCDCMGDALRLAVKLRISVMFGANTDVVRCDFTIPDRLMTPSYTHGADDDANAATRLAIVRAAASIGQQKGE